MRGGKNDAGGPEKQVILFVWPNEFYSCLITYPETHVLDP